MAEHAEKVKKTQITEEAGWVYSVDEKGIYRTPEEKPDARKQWVLKERIPVEDGYVYFLDDDGDVARLTYDDARALIIAEKVALRKVPPLLRPMVPPLFELRSGQAYRILSIHGPWAWAIIFAGKDIENRSRATPHRGPILVHASSRKYVGQHLDEARDHIATCSGLPLDDVPSEFPRSQILGVVEVLDCVQSHPSPWAEEFGAINWVLGNPRQLNRPVPNIDGKLNLWSWPCP